MNKEIELKMKNYEELQEQMIKINTENFLLKQRNKNLKKKNKKLKAELTLYKNISHQNNELQYTLNYIKSWLKFYSNDGITIIKKYNNKELLKVVLKEIEKLEKREY